MLLYVIVAQQILRLNYNYYYILDFEQYDVSTYQFYS
jgi:hypothetical protein